jgi:hypothetical protein
MGWRLKKPRGRPGRFDGRRMWVAYDENAQPFAASHARDPAAESLIHESCLDKRGATYRLVEGDDLEKALSHLMRKRRRH